MTAILKLLLDAILGALTSAFMDWRKDVDRIKAHEDLRQKQVEDAQKGAVIDAVKERKAIEDDVARMSDDDVTRELQQWGQSNSRAGH